MYNPFTDLGRLTSEVQDLERKLNEKANDYEIWNLKQEIDKIQYQIASIENTLSYLQNDVEILKQKEIERNP
jgi:predicted  nucleic acid-binding Zn-ribbon protein